MIKAIIFDNNGVLWLGKYSLIPFRRHKELSIHNLMARHFRINLDQWFDVIDTPYAGAIEGKISKEKALSIISKDLETNPAHLERLWVQAYRKYFKRNKTLFDLAFSLKKKGYRIAILSDQWPVSKEALMFPEDIRKFNESVVSCDVGVRKPNLRIFTITIKKLHIKPSECIFIDNQKWNLKPAARLGMKTILFENNSKTIKDLKKLGVEI